MILRDLIMTVNNTTATLNEPLQIYRFDRGITLRIQVMKYKFVFNKVVEEDVIVDSSIISARAILLKPDGETVLECPRTPIEEDKVVIHIPLDWTNEPIEVGNYLLQVQLYGSDYINERVSLPPVGFVVADTIGFYPEDGVPYPPVVDDGVTDGSGAGDGEIDDDGDLPYGIYEETNWKPGDIITAANLNKIEDALEYVVRTQKVKAIYTPSVSDNGDLSWTNDLDLENPATVNIKGPKGDKGQDGTVAFDELTEEQRLSLKGEKGDKGQDGTVAFDELTDEQRESLRGPALAYEDLTDEQKADWTKGFITCTYNISRIEVVTDYPEVEEEGVLYIKVSDR